MVTTSVLGFADTYTAAFVVTLVDYLHYGGSTTTHLPGVALAV